MNRSTGLETWHPIQQGCCSSDSDVAGSGPLQRTVSWPRATILCRDWEDDPHQRVQSIWARGSVFGCRGRDATSLFCAEQPSGVLELTSLNLQSPHSGRVA
ncbi:hypothetical protein LIA77_00686 [Sarocladium implicatum]|nr:hypothetical protein LIA77_00686 [Sarocladium implicatum]